MNMGRRCYPNYIQIGGTFVLEIPAKELPYYSYYPLSQTIIHIYLCPFYFFSMATFIS